MSVSRSGGTFSCMDCSLRQFYRNRRGVRFGGAGFDCRSGNRKLRREFLVGLTIFLLLHPFFVKVVHFGHRVISFARYNENATSDASAPWPTAITTNCRPERVRYVI